LKNGDSNISSLLDIRHVGINNGWITPITNISVEGGNHGDKSDNQKAGIISKAGMKLNMEKK